MIRSFNAFCSHIPNLIESAQRAHQIVFGLNARPDVIPLYKHVLQTFAEAPPTFDVFLSSS